MIRDAPGPWWKRLAWFVGLWVAGVAVMLLIGYGLRLFLGP